MVLFGVSNMLSDVYDCVRALGKKVTRIVLNEPEQKRERTKDLETRLRELNEQPMISRVEEFEFSKDEEYFVVPTTPKKSDLVEFLKRNYHMQFTNLVHPAAYISPYAKIGQGVYIGVQSVIAPGAVLKDHVFINRGVTVGHDTVIHEYVRLQPGCNIGGHVEILPNAMIGMGANVIEELVVGRGSVVAAGSAVISDVKERTLVAGVPAVVKKVYEK
jgi:sugar O-acyltransferase (sialic acid O-acetyltransferase NeuD family)